MAEPAEVRSMFARIAGRYDLLNALLSAGMDRRWRAAALAAAGDVRGRRVVDACCGTGDLTLVFAAAGARAVGVDFTPEMLLRTRSKLERVAARGATRAPAVRQDPPLFAAGDALALPVRSASADVCSVAFGLRNVADRSACLAELRRVTRPGGRVIVLEFTMPPGSVLGPLYRLYFTRILPAVGRLVSKDDEAYAYLPRTVLAWPAPAELEAELQAVGLVECGHRLLTRGICCLHWGRVPADTAADTDHGSAVVSYEEDEEDEDFDPSLDAGRRTRGLALGFLALVPLLVAYELGLIAGQGASRSSAELVLFYVTSVFGPHGELVRRALLGACTTAALVVAFKNHLGLLPSLFRQTVEGALAALVLGPALIGGIHLADALLGPLAVALDGTGLPPLGAPGLGSAARVLGAAAYEELVFRLGAMSILILSVRSVSGFLVGGASTRTVGAAAEAIAIVGSSLVFAAFHLDAFTGWLGPGGEPWNAAVFTWRVLAGMLLAGLFRWRGIGVAAWAHGLFNLALMLGAGPDVFL